MSRLTIFRKQNHGSWKSVLGYGQFHNPNNLVINVKYLSMCFGYIRFISSKYNGHLICAFNAQDLLSNEFYILEALSTSQAEHDYEALSILDVQITHWRKLLRTSCVQDFKDSRVTVDFNLFSVKVLHCGIIAFNELTGYKLDRQGWFSNSARPIKLIKKAYKWRQTIGQ